MIHTRKQNSLKKQACVARENAEAQKPLQNLILQLIL